MMIKIKKLIACSFLAFLVSCGEDSVIDLPMNDGSGKIVIEGNITDDGDHGIVKVTRSVKISDVKSEYKPISNAKVVISDNHG